MNKQLSKRNYQSDWEVVPLSTFAKDGNTDFVDGPFGSNLKVSDYTEDGIRVLQLQNLGDGRFINESRIYTSRKKAFSLRRCLTYPGDIIIAKMAEPLARAALVLDYEDEYLIVADLIRLRVSQQVDPYYLLVFINFSDFRKEAERLSTGTTRTRISLSTLKKISVPKPPLQVQKKLGHIFKAFDDAIAHTETLIEKYQQIKAGLMHDLFTRGIGADGKLRPPRDQAPELYQESAIGWIPKEWEVSTLDCIKENLVDGPFGSNLKTEHYVSDPGVRVVRLQNIQPAKYNDFDRAFVSEKHANSLIRNKVVGNDILIAGLGEDRNPVGRSCLYPDALPPAINKADCFRLRCLEGEAINGFVMYFLNTEAAKKQIKKYEQGVTRPRINLGNFKRIAIPKPILDEQMIVCERLNKIEQKIDMEVAIKEKLELQKSGLMHDLLTGKTPVNINSNQAAHV